MIYPLQNHGLILGWAWLCSQVHFGFEGLKEKDVEGGIHGVGTVLELVLNSRLVWVRNPRSILNSLEVDMGEESGRASKEGYLGGGLNVQIRG